MLLKPKILLIGTGAVGSYYSSMLAKAGADVSAICRSDYEIVKKNGILIKSSGRNYKFIPESVHSIISDYEYQPDYILIATKVLPEIDIPGMIESKVSKNTSIFLLQNGINIEKPIADAFPENEIISGLAFICVSRIKPGLIDHQDYGRIVIGRYPSGSESSDKVKKLHELFNKAEVDCTIENDIIAARWKKLVWNAPFNPISVLAGGVDTKTMLESEPTYNLIKDTMKEVVTLSVADNHPVNVSIIQKNLDDTYRMKPYKTSMLLDYENSRQMEVEAILGNASRLAKKYDVDTPCIDSLYGLLYLLNKENIK